MSKAWLALIGVALLTFGYGVGWHQKGVSVEAAASRGDRQALSDMTADVTQQITDHTAQLQAQQDESARLIAQQRLVRSTGADIRLEITHAVFTPAEPLGIAASCPDPSGTAEFVRLYDAAAKGADAAHPGSSGASGVP